MNLVNFQTMVASKAVRSVLVAGGKSLIDFGLRRAHGAEAALLAARAAYLVGFSGSATVLAGMAYGIPTYGTMAHSFVQAHKDEAQAFEHFHDATVAHAHALDLTGPTAAEHADQAARTLVGGLFEIVEIYDPAGLKLAEQLTAEGHALEHMLPKHVRPESLKPEYESLLLPDGRWAMRVMVPLTLPGQKQRTGYFEGVRLVPDWQHRQIQSDALVAALMALLASLACGAAIYPVVIHLAGENERKALQVLESHIAMMEALGRAIAKRDSDTGTHNYRVAWMAATLGESLGLSGAAMQALIAGSFLHDPLPTGADLVTLLRVVHDHDDAAVLCLLRAVHAGLVPGGRLLLAEPMSGTPGADAMGDAYFGFYLLAMGQGRPRPIERLEALLREAGFARVRRIPTRQPLLVQVLTAEKPARSQAE